MSNWVISHLLYLHNGALALQSNPDWDENCPFLFLDQGIASIEEVSFIYRKWTAVHTAQISTRQTEADFNSTLETPTNLIWNDHEGGQRGSCPKEPHDAVHCVLLWTIFPSSASEKQFFLLNGCHLPQHSPPHSWVLGTSSTLGTSPRQSHYLLGNFFWSILKAFGPLPIYLTSCPHLLISDLAKTTSMNQFDNS